MGYYCLAIFRKVAEFNYLPRRQDSSSPDIGSGRLASGFTDSGSECGTGSGCGSGNYAESVVFGSCESVDNDDLAVGESDFKRCFGSLGRGLGLDESGTTEGSSGRDVVNFGADKNGSARLAGGALATDNGNGNFTSENCGSGNFCGNDSDNGVTLRRPRSAGSGSVYSATASGDVLPGSSFGDGGSLLSAVETAEANKRLSFQEKRQFFESL